MTKIEKDHLGGGDDHRLCGLADRILWLKSTFALMAKARLKKNGGNKHGNDDAAMGAWLETS